MNSITISSRSVMMTRFARRDVIHEQFQDTRFITIQYITTSIDQQHMCALFTNIKQLLLLRYRSPVCLRSTSTQKVLKYFIVLDRQSTCCKSPHHILASLTIDLASICDNQSIGRSTFRPFSRSGS